MLDMSSGRRISHWISERFMKSIEFFASLCHNGYSEKLGGQYYVNQSRFV